MEKNKPILANKKYLLGKKLKNSLINLESDKNTKSDGAYKDSILFETSTEFSYENSINLDERNGKILDFDNLNIPSFFNDININNDINRKIKNYYRIKKELGSKELSKLFLIDIKRLYKEREKHKV